MGLTRRKDSYYVEFRVIDDGKTLRLATNMPGSRLKRWKVYCKNKERAKVEEAAIRQQLIEGVLLLPVVQAVPVTFGEYVTGWLAAAKHTLAPKTHCNYEQLLRLYILPALQDQTLSLLTWGTIKALLVSKQQVGLSVNSIRLIRAVISTILTDAAEEEVIANNPVLGQRRKRRASQINAPDVHPFSWEEKQTFEAHLDQVERDGVLSPTYAMLFHLYLKTGLRPGEGRALCVGDVDFIGKRLRVERAATLQGAIKNTKTGETRWVDLSNGLLDRLAAYLTCLKAEAIMQGREVSWLFPSKTSTLLDESHVTRSFHKILDQAGLPRFRVYDLRHTFASLLLSSNVPLLYVSHQLGHTKPTITLKYYARWIPSGHVHRVNVLDTAEVSNTLITLPGVSHLETPIASDAMC